MSLLLFACDSSQVYDEYQSLSGFWNKSDVVSFRISPPDSIKPYNLFLNLRNSSDYKFNNLHLIVELNYPNGKVLKDTLEFRMTETDGTFLGSGFTDIKENKLWYKELLVFEESGEYEVNIQHAMRVNGEVNGIETLEGITDIGFRIEHPQID